MTRPARDITKADYIRAGYFKGLRIKNNMTQEQVVEAVGTSQNSLYKLEDAQTMIANSSVITIAKYAALYGTTIDDIFTAGGLILFRNNHSEANSVSARD